MTELSFQLYSARNYPSLDDFLAKLAQLGYTQVKAMAASTPMLPGLPKSSSATGFPCRPDISVLPSCRTPTLL